MDFGNDFSTANAIINEQNGIITVISEGQLQGQLQETNGGTTYEYIPLQTVNAGENGPQTRDPIQVRNYLKDFKIKFSIKKGIRFTKQPLESV